MIQETFHLLPYWFDNGNNEPQAIKRFALIRNTYPFYIRVCSTPDAENKTLFPLMGVNAKYGESKQYTSFNSKYREAQRNDDVATMQELAPKIAIGFAAYLISKAIWNDIFNEWDNLSEKDVERYIQEYDNARDKRYTIERHRANEPEYWAQTQELWQASGIEEFDNGAIDLWCKVYSGVKQYIGNKIEAQRLLCFFKSQDDCEKFVSDANQCEVYNDLARVIEDYKRKYILQAKTKKEFIDYLYDNSEIPSITRLKRGKMKDKFYEDVKREKY